MPVAPCVPPYDHERQAGNDTGGVDASGDGWYLKQNDQLLAVLRGREIEMFWTECRLEVHPGYAAVRPLVEAFEAALRQVEQGEGEWEAAGRALKPVLELEWTLEPFGRPAQADGAPIQWFMLRVDEAQGLARFRLLSAKVVTIWRTQY